MHSSEISNFIFSQIFLCFWGNGHLVDLSEKLYLFRFELGVCWLGCLVYFSEFLHFFTCQLIGGLLVVRW